MSSGLLATPKKHKNTLKISSNKNYTPNRNHQLKENIGVWARNDSCLFRKQPCGQHAATQGSQFAVHLQDVVNVTPS